MKNVTWKDIGEHERGKSHLVEKELKPGCYQPRANGRSSYLLICPFCKADVECFIWSYQSCGKRCDCGAMLGWRSAWHFKEPDIFYNTMRKI